MTPRLPRIPIPCPIHRITLRTLSTTPNISRDVMAKYRPRLPDPIPASISPSPVTGNGPKDRKGTFETSSTSPVGSSIQEVPPPDSSAGSEGVRKAVPLPAMNPIEPENVKPAVKVEDREMVVQGVVIPAKPRPPHEEGKSIPLRYPHTRTLKATSHLECG